MHKAAAADRSGGAAVALVEGAATARRAGEQQLGRLEAAAQPWSSVEVWAEAEEAHRRQLRLMVKAVIWRGRVRCPLGRLTGRSLSIVGQGRICGHVPVFLRVVL